MLPGVSHAPMLMASDSPFFLEQIVGAGLGGSNLKVLTDYADIRCWPGSGEVLTDLSGNACHLNNGIDGTTTGNMNYVGTAGSGTKNSYFIQNVASNCHRFTTAPTWIANAHKDGALFTLAGWFYLAGTSSSVRAVFSNYRVAVDATRGYAIMAQSGQFHWFTDNSYRYSSAGGAVLYDQWFFLLVSVNEPTGTCMIQVNGTQYTSAPGAFSMTTTAAGSNNTFVGTNSGRTDGMQVNSRHAGIFGWDIALSSAQGLAAWNATKARFA